MSFKGFLTKEETYPYVATRECAPGWYASQQYGDKLYRLEYWGKGRYADPDDKRSHLIQTLYVQGWLWGGCSSCGVWGWAAIAFDNENTRKDNCAEFLMALREVYKKAGYGYDPHRIFVQCPVGKEYGFGAVCKIVSGNDNITTALPRPAYRFNNRSHSSVEQRVYDVEVDKWWEWAEAHLANKAKEKQNVQESKTTVAVGRNGVGQRPVAPGEFRAAARL